MSLGTKQDQWVSTFLLSELFNTVHHVTVTPAIKLIPSLLHSRNFAIVMNRNVTEMKDV